MESAKTLFRRWFDRLTRNRADAYYVNAEAVARTVRERERVPADRIWVVPTGVDTKETFVPQEPDEGIRGKLGIAAGEAVVVNVGRLDKYKGQQYLLEALKIAVERGCPYRLIIVGEGPLRGALEEQARSLGIKDWVVFVGAQEKVAPYLSLANCFALTSTEEGLPGSLLEAMSMTTASLAVNVGGVGEVIRNGRTGYLVNSPSPAAIAERLSYILANREEARTVGEEARRFVEEKCDLGQMVKRTEEMYEALIRGPKASNAGVRAA